jgi:hypothetical protein
MNMVRRRSPDQGAHEGSVMRPSPIKLRGYPEQVRDSGASTIRLSNHLTNDHPTIRLTLTQF